MQHKTTHPLAHRAHQFLARFAQDQSGNYALIVALSAPLVLGAAALATEGGLWLHKSQSVQGAADSAAVSAANAYRRNTGSNLTLEGQAIAATYGFPVSTAGNAVTVTRPAATGPYAGQAGAVEVTISTQQQRFLSAIFIAAPVTIVGHAVALAGTETGCLLALNSSASSAISFQGGASVTLKGCSIYDNSTSANALQANGSASVSALSAKVVGGVSGASQIATTNGISTGVSPAQDPYAGVPMPAYGGCNFTNLKINASTTLNPGVYCNGVQINAGAVVTLNPGVYVFNRGTLSVNGSATLRGTGVTLFFTSNTGSNYADLVFNGGATINLVAPTSGPYAGIVFFGDRNMPNSTTFKLTAGTNQIIGGATYIPEGAIQYSGGVNANATCTQVIGDTIGFAGNSTLAIDCSAYATNGIGSSETVLVE